MEVCQMETGPPAPRAEARGPALKELSPSSRPLPGSAPFSVPVLRGFLGPRNPSPWGTGASCLGVCLGSLAVGEEGPIKVHPWRQEEEAGSVPSCYFAPTSYAHNHAVHGPSPSTCLFPGLQIDTGEGKLWNQIQQPPYPGDPAMPLGHWQPQAGLWGQSPPLAEASSTPRDVPAAQSIHRTLSPPPCIPKTYTGQPRAAHLHYFILLFQSEATIMGI